MEGIFLKVNINSFSFKIVAAPLSCAYFDSLALFVIINKRINIQYIVPLLLLTIITLWDILTRRYSSKEDNFSRKVLAATFIVFPVAVALPYLEHMPFKYKSIGNVVFSLGCLTEILGGYLILHSRSLLGSYGTVNIIIEEDHKLVKEGLYKYVRNPMYVGFLIMLLGYCVSIYGFISVALIESMVFIVLNKRALLEEALLGKQFGEEYRRYKEQTGRYLPKKVRKVSRNV